MKKNILIPIIFFCVFFDCAFAQSKQPISFSYSYVRENDYDNLKLIVKNMLHDKTLYYAISVSGLTDTGWAVLNSDINSIGQNDFLALKPLKPKSTNIKCISKIKILFIYAYFKPKKIKFSLMYYQKKDFETEGNIIDLPPLKE